MLSFCSSEEKHRNNRVDYRVESRRGSTGANYREEGSIRYQ